MSETLTVENLRLLMGLTFFGAGLIALGAGMLILIRGPFRQEAQVLAQQSARLSQKALTDDIGAIVGNATALVDAVNNLIKTSSGNAIVLLVVGALFEAAAYRLLIVG